ncbi:glycoside hydrolase family 18 protein [Candidatus Saccharibacteria bacterium]|nr:glycoside hydrolase family 18 protein [Candidatus Saccharibacteria bacterium]
MSVFARRMQRVMQPQPAKIVAAYYTGYSRASSGVGNTSIANLNWQSFSHIIDFSVGIDNGHISATWLPNGASSYAGNSWNAGQATTLCSTAASNNRKVLLGIGGGSTSDSWNANLDTPFKRAQIIADICTLMTTHGYNGVDLDGEPGYLITNYRTFWQELLAEFNYQGWRTPGDPNYKYISIALFGSETALAKNAVLDGVDWVGAMLYSPYETTSRHLSPLTGSGDPWDSWVSAWTTGTNAIPSNKVLPGFSYYAYSWDNTTGPNQVGTQMHTAYYWKTVEPHIGGVTAPNATWYSPAMMHGMFISSGWFSFETDASIQAKADWVTSNNCGGVIIWPYQMGSMDGVSHPLANSVQTYFGPLM